MNSHVKLNLINLFKNWSLEKKHNITQLPQSGSYREYYRIEGEKKKAIGVFNLDNKENIAFLTMTKHFFNKGLNVPQVYTEDLDNNTYLIQDLGNITLFSYLKKNYKDDNFPNELIKVYKKVITQLPKFQITAGNGLDYSVCYPRSAFDKQSMMWDLNYFKYYFLKLAKIAFDEQLLEDDFHNLTDYLLQADDNYFLYRDFQSQNIMLYNNKPYFIDYQGGRKGALQYDIASLLYDSKANMPTKIRSILLEFYIQQINEITPINRDHFLKYYYGYVLIRIMQAMGAYGFRGFYERKAHFLESIPYAINDLSYVLKYVSPSFKIPHLCDTLKRMINLTSQETLKLLRP